MAHADLYTRSAPRRTVVFGRTPRLASLIDLWRSRQALAKLDAHALQDIGISAKEAQNEAQKPVWDVPKNWLK